MRFRDFIQIARNDCGLSCIVVCAILSGVKLSLEDLRSKIYISNGGLALRNISDILKGYGLDPVAAHINYGYILNHLDKNYILHVDKSHYVVLLKIREKFCCIFDPSFGKIKLDRSELETRWLNPSTECGVALIVKGSLKKR